MINYKELYLKLFSAAADALDALDNLNIGQAKDILLRAQLDAEEAHMCDEAVSKTCDFLEKL